MKTQRLRYLRAKSLGSGIDAQEFRVGQRVRLNELGIARTPRSSPRTGTVVGLPTASSIAILFDGNKTPTKLHRSYVELDDS
jgi:hypothetical protein